MNRNGATGCYLPAARERPRAVSLGLGCVLVVSLACTAAATTDHPVPTTSSGSEPTTSPPASAAETADALAAARSHIRHVIFLIKENRQSTRCSAVSPARTARRHASR